MAAAANWCYVELNPPGAVGDGADAARLRHGLSALLQTYVVNVPCAALVLSPHYESIAVVDGAAPDAAVVAGCCYRKWPTRDGLPAFVELALIAVDHAHQGRGLGAAGAAGVGRGACAKKGPAEAS